MWLQNSPTCIFLRLYLQCGKRQHELFLFLPWTGCKGVAHAHGAVRTKCQAKLANQISVLRKEDQAPIP